MNAQEFCYWLQGFFEISQHIDHREGLPKEAVDEIRNHLNLVFKKVTPEVTPFPPTVLPVVKRSERTDGPFRWPDHPGVYFPKTTEITCSTGVALSKDRDSLVGDYLTSDFAQVAKC